MPLVTLNEILPKARQNKRAVAAFNVANLETLLGVFKAAEQESSPVIIQVYQRLFKDERAELIAAMAARLAGKTDIPIVLHLDHGTSIEQLKRAIEIGYTSVMIDGSQLSLNENIDLTAGAVDIAHRTGVSIEAEIGHVPFGDGKVELSTPEEAVKFAGQTGVDALAISIGTAHGFYKEEPYLDIERAMEIGKSVSIPLVLHGGTGVPEEQLKKAIECGVAKINIATELQNLFIRGIASELEKNGEKFIPVDLYFRPVEEKITEYARAKIRVCGIK
ncbi:MAG: 5-dehydro-2-deoxyphosphogluconate aldolase [Candidatus Uhrbacteria bacterium GW2011_GWF2_39_13]|uniref:5-dehydro-2-deoxyphosphogluconate aldolase n=1 Tax=Candidatus Uhrbacteria bacterium GW2011_GWF2_39_13 TaxID=1618995 RepID=A0A0G0ML26_9BACT|nr:MAG: 5-dehydro-2-deoxyphosphogluconate aldolase [Candidatus Uhrbacteria bacterium GW2011_GWF2_39_13]